MSSTGRHLLIPHLLSFPVNIYRHPDHLCREGKHSAKVVQELVLKESLLRSLLCAHPKYVVNSCSDGWVQPPWVFQSVGDQTGCDHEDDFEKSCQQLQVVLCSLEVTSLNSQCLLKPQSHTLLRGVFLHTPTHMHCAPPAVTICIQA